MQETLTQTSTIVLTNGTFQQLSEFISRELGIKMPLTKRSMLQGRLMKRLRTLKMNSFEAYCQYLFSPAGKTGELVHMLDAVTTNKTDFFREPRHFDILTRTVLPEFVNSRGKYSRRQFTLWSAGCSSGAEPYTLAMIMNEFAQAQGCFDYLILATDISTRVLIKARDAVYTENEVNPVPPVLKKKYLLRSKNREQGLVRLVPGIRNKVVFRRLNFMDQDYALTDVLDVIFCRNVIIYFDRGTQLQVLRRLCRHLRPDGYLFMGHSETLNGFDLPLKQVSTTVYRKIG